MALLKGTQADDLTLKYLLQNEGGGEVDVPQPAEDAPLADGTVDIGTSDKYAREDHVHPFVLNVPTSGTPADLGTANNGSATTYARSDHVHKKPSITSFSGTLAINHGGTGKTTAAEALANLGGISIKKLWTNSSPASSFSAKKISIDLTDYQAAIIIYRYGTSTNRVNSLILPVSSSGGLLIHAGNFSSASAYIFIRNVTDIDTTGITFGDSYRRSLNSSTAASASNDYCYPVEIYGIKGIT